MANFDVFFVRYGVACFLLLILSPAVSFSQGLSKEERRSTYVRLLRVSVEPFVNISGDPEDDWIGSGIAETVSASFDATPSVSIVNSVTRSEVASATQQQSSGAFLLVTGSYQRLGDQIRISARVNDPDSGRLRATVIVDGNVEDIFVLQDQIAEKLLAGFESIVNTGRELTDVEAQELVAGADRPLEDPSDALGIPEVPTSVIDSEAAVLIVPPDNADIPDEVVDRRAARESRQEDTPAFGVATGVGILTGRPTVQPVRASVRPEIDGRLDDVVWQNALRLTEFVQQNPVEGAPATEETDVWISYDSQNIYVAVHAHYKDPSMMRVNRVDRDQSFDDDNISVYFDTFVDQQRAYRFSVNGYGVQGDAVVNARGFSRGGGRGRRGSGGGGGMFGGSRVPTGDPSWDALFESAGQVVEDGFTAEMAIPVKSLRYPEQDQDVPHRWGFQVVREIHGKDEFVVWAPVTRDVSGFLTQMGLLEGMTNLSLSRNIEIMPTFTAVQFGSLNDQGIFVDGDPSPEGGLNLKYGITSNLTADFTYNPDFSQIESDQPQIEVNQRFALFYPELRPFFLEGAEIFQILGPVTFLNTRTIVDPEYGGKITGKVGSTTVGLIVANDEAPGNEVLPGNVVYGKKANNIAGRARYDLYAESYVGAIFTHRSFHDTHSTLGGVDGNFRMGSNHSAGFQAIQTDHRDNVGIDRQGQMFNVNYVLNSRNWNGFVGIYSLSPTFRNDLGFVRRVDQKRSFTRIGYTWWPQKWIISWGPSVMSSNGWNFDNVFEDSNNNFGINATFAKNISVNASYRDEMERYRGINFDKKAFSFGGRVNSSRRISVGGYYRRGDEVKYQENPYLGYGGTGNVFATVRPISRFQSDLSLNISNFMDPTTGDVVIFDVKIFRTLSTFQFSDRLLFRNITEYNTYDRTLALNALFTYRVNAGTVFYIGYDDHYQQADRILSDMNGDGFNEQPFPMLSTLQQTNRAFFMKFQYLFRY